MFFQVSTCIAFPALLQKDTRGTAGLRGSGVGGVCVRMSRVCAAERDWGIANGREVHLRLESDDQ
jgi:hypothetical protein